MTDDLAPGLRVLQRFELLDPVGEGGMATVWRARDLQHDRLVAVKVIRAELSAGISAERFQREIQLTARLQHPHILPLIDSGALPDGRLLYIMPFVEGPSLRARLEQQSPLPIDEALTYAREIGDALGYAHAQGIVHRDVKPENVLLVQGHALVADFGIATATAAAAAPRRDARLTVDGISLGTPAYMAPEQAAGDPDVDARSDIYALGCVTFELLAGRAPFAGLNRREQLQARLTKAPPSVRAVRPDVPAAVDALLQRSLAVPPEERPADGATFVRELAAAAAPPVRTRRWPLVAAVLLLVAAGAGAAWWRARQPTVATLGRRLTDLGNVLTAVPAPDGRQIAVATYGEHALLVIDTVPDAVPRRLGGNHQLSRVFRLQWNDDATAVSAVALVDSVAGVWSFPAAGGDPSLLLRLPADQLNDFFVGRSARGEWAWSPGPGILRIGPALPTGLAADEAPPRTRTLPLGGGRRIITGEFSPDGSRLAFYVNRIGEYVLQVFSTDGTAAAEMPLPMPFGGEVAWLDARTIVLTISAPTERNFADLLRVRLSETGARIERVDTVLLGSISRIGFGTARPLGTSRVFSGTGAVPIGKVTVEDPQAPGGWRLLSKGSTSYNAATCVGRWVLGVSQQGGEATVTRFARDGSEATRLWRGTGDPIVSALSMHDTQALLTVLSAPGDFAAARTYLLDVAAGQSREVGPGLGMAFLQDDRVLLGHIEKDASFRFSTDTPGPMPALPAFSLKRIEGPPNVLRGGQRTIAVVPEGMELWTAGQPTPTLLRTQSRRLFGFLADTIMVDVPGQWFAPGDPWEFRLTDLRTLRSTVERRTATATLSPLDMCGDRRVVGLDYAQTQSDVYLLTF